MANIYHNNFYDLKMNLNFNEYWDFVLNKDGFDRYNSDVNVYTKCLISYIDVKLYDCVFENDINSLPSYVWDKSLSIGYELKNIGYTGFDNGLIYFRKDKIMNKDFLKLYQESKFDIQKDLFLKLHMVSGSTMSYDYPITVNDFDIKLNGGFYQGFFKTECDKYQVLPTVFEDGDVWSYEFVLNRYNHQKESDKTLNDKYPNNKGIFFYIGTRAENKWIYLYDEEGNDKCFTLSPDEYVDDAYIDPKTFKIDSFLDMELTMPQQWEDEALDEYINDKYTHNELYNHTNLRLHKNTFDKKKFNNQDYEMNFTIKSCDNIIDKCSIFGEEYLDDNTNTCEYDYLEDDIDISDFEYYTDEDFVIGKWEDSFETDNKFLLFDRTCNGMNVNNWKNGTYIKYIFERNTFNDNLFLIMNRTCSGHTIDNIQSIKNKYKAKYDIYQDLYNNALAFRITDDGKIGYRYLIKGCDIDNKYTILESYSKPNIVPYNEWFVVHVKLYAYEKTMKIKFYVNGNLVYVTDEIPKLNLKALDEVYEKQETVPFNISIGGGTQGLCDVILPNYMIQPYRVYPLEKNFAGTFIGFFQSFKFYNCDLEYLDILNNFKYEINNLDIC